MIRYKLAAKLFAVLESDDDPEVWEAIFSDSTEEELPLMVRIKSAMIQAINKLLEEGEQ